MGDEGVVVAVGSEKERGRITLDLEWVPKPGAETGAAAEFDRIQEPFRRDV